MGLCQSWAEASGTSDLTNDSTAFLCSLQTVSAQGAVPTAVPGEPSAAQALAGTQAFAADVPFSRSGWQSCCSGRCKQRDPLPRGAGEDGSWHEGPGRPVQEARERNPWGSRAGLLQQQRRKHRNTQEEADGCPCLEHGPDLPWSKKQGSGWGAEVPFPVRAP